MQDFTGGRPLARVPAPKRTREIGKRLAVARRQHGRVVLANLIEEGQEALEVGRIIDNGRRAGRSEAALRGEVIVALKDGGAALLAGDWQDETHRPFKCLLEATHFV